MASSADEQYLLLKEQGNDAYRSGDVSGAVLLFTQAIALHPTEVVYTNRSLCYASQGKWKDSLEDANKALQLNSKHVKAYYRQVKALIELGRGADARNCLLFAHKELGSVPKELVVLEDEVLHLTGVPLKISINDFRYIEDLGEGNFTRVYLAEFKKTSALYAIKCAEKATVDKVKKRHKNVNNELLMEKRVLNKLSHPNIIKLFSTFQDPSTLTLYYQLEYCPNAEVWKLLFDGIDKDSVPIGCHWSVNKYFISAIIDAIEYMHNRGVVHRDLKPENLMISETGILKIIDFGTAKDLNQTDLNGPEFVGTPDYMCPTTVKGRTLSSDAEAISADLWALGVIVYQLFFGVPAFQAPSPYLTFLRIQRGNVRIPSSAPDCVRSFISLLLVKDNKDRIRNCIDAHIGEQRKDDKLEYTVLRGHALFHTSIDCATPTSTSSFGEVQRVPSLLCLCVRQVGRACEQVTDVIAEHGSRSSIPDDQTTLDWVRDFDLLRLPIAVRSRIAHYLQRRNRLHPPSTTRLFYSSAVDAKLLGRVDPMLREVIGFHRDMKISHHVMVRSNKKKLGYNDDPEEYAFHFLHISDPRVSASVRLGESALGKSSSGEQPYVGVDSQDTLRKAISAANKLRPRFVLLSGNLVSPSAGADRAADVDAFKRVAGRISETVPLLLVPGESDVCDVGEGVPTPASIEAYRLRLGCDYYGLWFGAIRVLVLNSTLLFAHESAPLEYAAQNAWLAEELEQSVLCADKVFVVTYHAWFADHPGEDDSQGVVPRRERLFWLNRMRHKKVELLVSSCSARGTSARESLAASTTGVMCFAGGGAEDVGGVRELERLDDDVYDDAEGEDDKSFGSSDDAMNNGEEAAEPPHKAKPDPDYLGPLFVSSPSLGSAAGAGVRVVHVRVGEPVQQQYLDLQRLPARLDGDL